MDQNNVTSLTTTKSAVALHSTSAPPSTNSNTFAQHLRRLFKSASCTSIGSSHSFSRTRKKKSFSGTNAKSVTGRGPHGGPRRDTVDDTDKVEAIADEDNSEV